MRSHRAATRYAKSIIELAKEQKVLDEVFGDMKLFSAVVEQNRIFSVMLKNPIVNHDKKRKVLHALFDTRMNKFQVQYNDFKGLQVADITTTINLDDELRNKFNSLVEEISGKKASLNEIIDDDIVGGFVLNVGDLRLDQSIKTQLNNIKRELTN